jgi:predicted MFS family arabinose efflux permease
MTISLRVPSRAEGAGSCKVRTMSRKPDAGSAGMWGIIVTACLVLAITFGAWSGGLALEATGSYDWMWYTDIALAVFAALINLPIREPKTPRLAAAG